MVKGNYILQAAIFDSPRLAIVGYDNGTYTKHLHKTKRHDSIFDGRNSKVIIVKPCLP